MTTYRPRHRVQRWLGGGQHVKIQVSEAGEAIFGSSNLSRSSFEKWNEYSVALRGPVARVLLESYRQIGGIVDDAHLDALTTVAGPQAAGPDGTGAGGHPARLLAVQSEHAPGSCWDRSAGAASTS